jgi:lipopolysaccharide biosynthesis glycosyltransferase
VPQRNSSESPIGLSSGRTEAVAVACASDNGYAMALAATIRSAVAHLAQGRRMDLYVLDGGIDEHNKRRLRASWEDPRLTVQFVNPDLGTLQGLQVSGHININTYLRLLMPFVLPAQVRRAIYLDADLTVMRDLGELWDLDQGGFPCLAAQDVAAPCINAATLPAFPRCKNHVADLLPIANYRELGLPADGKYFNAGVLVVDLDIWRRENLAEKMLQVLRDNPEHVRYWDQYALNVVLAGRWKEIDPRWNQSAYVHAYPSWQQSPLDRETFHQLRDNPWIVHFCSPAKPWHYFCHHPNTQDFRKNLKETDWRDWSPPVPNDYLRKWWKFHFTPVRRFLKGYQMQVRELLNPAKARKAA